MGRPAIHASELAPTTMRRFQRHAERSAWSELPADHPAAVNGTTRYPATVRGALSEDRVLKSGHNSPKIGKMVTKGLWTGFPIYTLTLEERATCPRTCAHWRDCYGNKMHWSHRFRPGAELEMCLEAELAALQEQHPRGFVVRAHVLGDFYSTDYVRLWRVWLTRFPALRVFGYTAWQPDTEIGALIDRLANENWRRFAVRHSNSGRAERSTETIYDDARGRLPSGAIVCPAQSGDTDCCATCTLCWATRANVAFLAH